MTQMRCKLALYPQSLPKKNVSEKQILLTLSLVFYTFVINVEGSTAMESLNARMSKYSFIHKLNLEKHTQCLY